MAKDATARVEAYLASLPADQQAALQALRKTIRDTARGSEDGWSYGVPAVAYRGRWLVWYAAAKTHCSFFTGGQAIDDYGDQLAGRSLSKGTIRFTPADPLPADLVKRIVRDRMGAVDAIVDVKKAGKG
jgi:uncharacterized protein YdhG (YjbR/CyaY superfamily)